MADGFEIVNLPTSTLNEPNLEVEYFAQIYNESLDAFQSYMASLNDHLCLLYGDALMARVSCLGLDQCDMRLSGLLVQLALDERVSMLSGCDFLRLWNVDLLGLIGCTDCTSDNLLARFTDVLDFDLDICMTSIEYVYGISVANDFRLLIMLQVKIGRTVPDAVRDVLSGKYGVYYNWRQAFLQLDSEHTARCAFSFSSMGLHSTVPDSGSDANL
jgi:hypothetical protein